MGKGIKLSEVYDYVNDNHDNMVSYSEQKPNMGDFIFAVGNNTADYSIMEYKGDPYLAPSVYKKEINRWICINHLYEGQNSKNIEE